MLRSSTPSQVRPLRRPASDPRRPRVRRRRIRASKSESHTVCPIDHLRCSPPCRFSHIPALRLFSASQDSTLSTLLTVLNSVKATDIPSLLKSLSLDQRDALMKWIYKGLSKPETGSSGILLAWHEKVSSRRGDGEDRGRVRESETGRGRA